MTGRPKNFYVREALLEYINDLEDTCFSEHELEEVRAGRSVSVPLEEVMKQYDLED
ncbi:type II toxin-antitoxin system RelB family antitoxin [Candidatus Williamhamiltonella defendens]|uniref:type II toxin-antitoxin system RelB family antitoxin n=1 Tax=Candidatus Williamhamiltonella defendens TaxID=138072 RepID=UPI00035DBF8E|nr:hypothetical protein [Candidatus Hamiltonella defensa]